MSKNQSGDKFIDSMDKAYNAGYEAAKSANTVVNPYAYRMQASLYWEFQRGVREYLYPTVT